MAAARAGGTRLIDNMALVLLAGRKALAMLLTIDIGNTNTVLGVFDGDRVVEHWRIATVPDRTADELAVVLHGLLAGSSRVHRKGYQRYFAVLDRAIGATRDERDV